MSICFGENTKLRNRKNDLITISLYSKKKYINQGGKELDIFRKKNYVGNNPSNGIIRSISKFNFYP